MVAQPRDLSGPGLRGEGDFDSTSSVPPLMGFECEFDFESDFDLQADEAPADDFQFAL